MFGGHKVNRKWVMGNESSVGCWWFRCIAGAALLRRAVAACRASSRVVVGVSSQKLSVDRADGDWHNPCDDWAGIKDTTNEWERVIDEPLLQRESNRRLLRSGAD